MIGKQGRFWPACYGCFLSRTNKLLVPLPGIQLRSTWHGNQFPFNQAALSRTLVNPLYLTSLFTLGKETYKMRAMGVCQKRAGKRSFIIHLDSSKPAQRGGVCLWHHVGAERASLTTQGSLQPVISAPAPALGPSPSHQPSVPSPVCLSVRHSAFRQRHWDVLQMAPWAVWEA